ncbi:MAG: hypothetical protein KZQ59_07015 [Candidatus Thiodiazotropha sp. (ex Lucinoma aequizonata)]|nr:hypothetical protein [Candidatus Thiodiazotropha sp. (ex Lucinoma aequizonata)]MCU7908195.1 hypothetical protein [Candidatus Thiodiazotropha sp. (ex Lucinoma aequizonata)]
MLYAVIFIVLGDTGIAQVGERSGYPECTNPDRGTRIGILVETQFVTLGLAFKM